MKTTTGLRERVFRGAAAMAAGPVVTAVIQLGTVPLLVHAWGAEKYGNWLVLSAIPSYLSLTDLGFGDASGSDMTMKVACGDRDGAVETFQSSWVLLMALSAAMLTAVCSLVWLFPWGRWLHLSQVPSGQTELILCVLAGYVLVSQQGGVFESGYRCDGNFALGTLLVNLMRLAEVVAATLVGMVSGNLLWTALAYLLVRSSGVALYAAFLRSKSPWLRFGFGQARIRTIKRLLAPALGFVALPAGYALSLQGFTVAIGALLGPVAVTAFSTLRTLSRVGFQMLGIITNALWPELSAAFGTGNIALARRLHRSLYQAGLVVSVAVAALLWLAGPFIYHFWLGNAVVFNKNVFHLLLLVTVVNSLWYTSAVVPMSKNVHDRIALTLLVVTSVSLALACPMIRSWGLEGAALALLIIDACMSLVVVQTSLREVEDTAPGFLASLFTSSPLDAFIRGRAKRPAEPQYENVST